MVVQLERSKIAPDFVCILNGEYLPRCAADTVGTWLRVYQNVDGAGDVDMKAGCSDSVKIFGSDVRFRP